MKNNNPKSDLLTIFLLGLCCAVPLLFLVGGGTAFALGISFLTNNFFLLILGLSLAVVFIWLLLKRRGSE